MKTKLKERKESLPIILHPGGLEPPEWLRKRIVEARKNQSDSEFYEIATDEEALAYLHSLSLVEPLDEYYTRIYLYLATKVLKEEGIEVPEDLKVYSLDKYEEYLLKDLKYKIRSKTLRVKKGGVK